MTSSYVSEVAKGWFFSAGPEQTLKNPQMFHLFAVAVKESVAHPRTAVYQRGNSSLQTNGDRVPANSFPGCTARAGAYFSPYKIETLLSLGCNTLALHLEKGEESSTNRR